MRSITLITTVLSLIPFIVFAQPENFAEFVSVIVGLLNAVIPVIFGITFLAILWAGAQMVLNSDNPQKLADGRRTIMWGIIVLVIMVGMWGIFNIVANIFF